MDEDGKNTPVGVFAVGDTKFVEHAPDMRFDGPFAEDQALGDTSVGHPLRHQPEHLVLALRELANALLTFLLSSAATT